MSYVGKKENAFAFDLLTAQAQLQEMKSEITPLGARALLYLFNKNMRRSIQGLHVDMTGINVIREKLKAGYKIIFMPLYKTFLDFFILSYVNLTFGIPMGFTFGNFEDTPRIVLFDRILKTTGYVLSRRKQGQSVQSHYINRELLRETIARNQVTTIFQNAERFRADRLNRQSNSDVTIRWLIDVYCALNQASQKTMLIVPVTVSYDRIYESANLATEMINGEKQDYTLLMSLQKMISLKRDSLGDIYVKHLTPISA